MGGNDGANMYVYNPSNFSVNYATSAGSAGSVAWGNVTSRPTTLTGLTNDRSININNGQAWGMGGYGPTYYYNNPTVVDLYEYRDIPSTGWWLFDVLCGIQYYVDAYLYLEHSYATTMAQIYSGGAWRTIAASQYYASESWNRMNASGTQRLTWYEKYHDAITTYDFTNKPFYIDAGSHFRMRHVWTSTDLSTVGQTADKTRDQMNTDITFQGSINSPSAQSAGLRGYGLGTERSYGYFGGRIRGSAIRVD